MPRVDNGNNVAHDRLSLTNSYELWNSRKKIISLLPHHVNLYQPSWMWSKKISSYFPNSEMKRERDFGRFPLLKKPFKTTIISPFRSTQVKLFLLPHRAPPRSFWHLHWAPIPWDVQNGWRRIWVFSFLLDGLYFCHVNICIYIYTFIYIINLNRFQ